MNIGIDARLYGLEHSGIGRYIIELVHNLLKIDTDNRYTIFTATRHLKNIPPQKNLTTIPVDIRHYTIKEQLYLPKVFHHQNLDLIHVPHFNAPVFLATPFIVTIHDLLWHEVLGYNVTTLNPLAYTFKYLGYRLVVRHAVQKSHRVLVPSLWVKNQILNRFPVAPDKITVTHEAVGREFKTSKRSKTSSITRTFSLKKPFLVYTGSLYPHKNIKTLIKALSHLNTSSPYVYLVIVSARSTFTHQLRQYTYKLDQSKFVKFVGFLTDQELSRLYGQATALVHPSTSEGFGLTGLEAMAAGLPVISSHAASLPEIYGQAALYFNPKSSRDLSQKIRKIVKHKKLRQSLVTAGKTQAQKYSWEKMARETIKAYHQALKIKN